MHPCEFLRERSFAFRDVTSGIARDIAEVSTSHASDWPHLR
jgi:hypothetical protein